MDLTFLGNTYVKNNEVGVKPDVQLRYQGKVYRARQLGAARQVAGNTSVFTYRGVSYTR